MRAVIIVCLALLFCSCSLTKEERRMNRATKKLEKLVDKFPELAKLDTITVTATLTAPPVEFGFEDTLSTTIESVELPVVLTTINQSGELKPITNTLYYEHENDDVLMRLWLFPNGKYRIDGECKAREVTGDVDVQRQTIHPTKTVVKNVISTRQKIEIFLAVLAALLIGFVVGYLFGKK